MHSSINSDHHLLASLAAGDRRATEEIYKQNSRIFSAWLVKNGGNSVDAADIFQEAMVILFGKAEAPDFRLTCSLGTYLFAISKNLWFKRLQKQSRNPVFLEENLGADDSDPGIAYSEDIKVHEERELHYDQLNASLDQIGEPCRSLLKAFYHHDKSMQEIAADFGYTNPDNAKTQKYKCLARLRKLFYNVQAK